jgi:hypothetical protein
MRWRQPQFALFAVVLAVAIAFGAGAPPPAHAADNTETLLLWRDQDGQPSGQTKFFAVVTTTGATAPNGTVTVKLDDQPETSPTTLHERAPGDELAADACGNERCAITDDVVLDLGFAAHYLITKFAGNTDFGASRDDLGFAVAHLEASPEPSSPGQLVEYTFTLDISAATPDDKKPTGRVAFHDDDPDQPHRTDNPHPALVNLKATWQTGQRPGRWVMAADYMPGDADPFLPISASRAHNVIAPPPAPGETTTTRRPTTTVKPAAIARRTGTTAPLSPINPATTTTLLEGTTSSSFGSFPTTPQTRDLSAQKTNTDKKNDGPPLVVVVSTLVALGALGGVAAFRRYRRRGIDWF